MRIQSPWNWLPALSKIVQEQLKSHGLLSYENKTEAIANVCAISTTQSDSENLDHSLLPQLPQAILPHIDVDTC